MSLYSTARYSVIPATRTFSVFEKIQIVLIYVVTIWIAPYLVTLAYPDSTPYLYLVAFLHVYEIVGTYIALFLINKIRNL